MPGSPITYCTKQRWSIPFRDSDDNTAASSGLRREAAIGTGKPAAEPPIDQPGSARRRSARSARSFSTLRVSREFNTPPIASSVCCRFAIMLIHHETVIGIHPLRPSHVVERSASSARYRRCHEPGDRDDARIRSIPQSACSQRQRRHRHFVSTFICVIMALSPSPTTWSPPARRQPGNEERGGAPRRTRKVSERVRYARRSHRRKFRRDHRYFICAAMLLRFATNAREFSAVDQAELRRTVNADAGDAAVFGEEVLDRMTPRLHHSHLPPSTA